MLNTFMVYVENKPGVLTRVASLFRRRAFNIDVFGSAAVPAAVRRASRPPLRFEIIRLLRYGSGVAGKTPALRLPAGCQRYGCRQDAGASGCRQDAGATVAGKMPALL